VRSNGARGAAAYGPSSTVTSGEGAEHQAYLQQVRARTQEVLEAAKREAEREEEVRQQQRKEEEEEEQAIKQLEEIGAQHRQQRREEDEGGESRHSDGVGIAQGSAAASMASASLPDLVVSPPLGSTLEVSPTACGIAGVSIDDDKDSSLRDLRNARNRTKELLHRLTFASAEAAILAREGPRGGTDADVVVASADAASSLAYSPSEASMAEARSGPAAASSPLPFRRPVSRALSPQGSPKAAVSPMAASPRAWLASHQRRTERLMGCLRKASESLDQAPVPEGKATTGGGRVDGRDHLVPEVSSASSSSGNRRLSEVGHAAPAADSGHSGEAWGAAMIPMALSNDTAGDLGLGGTVADSGDQGGGSEFENHSSSEASLVSNGGTRRSAAWAAVGCQSECAAPGGSNPGGVPVPLAAARPLCAFA